MPGALSGRLVSGRELPYGIQILRDGPTAITSSLQQDLPTNGFQALATARASPSPPKKKKQTTTKSNRWKETHSISAYSSPVAQSAVCPTLMGLKAELRRLCDTTRQVRHKARAVPIPNSHQHWETSQKTGTQHPKHWDLTAPHTLLCCKCCLQNPVSTSRGKKHKLEYINL